MSRTKISEIVKKEILFNQDYNCNKCFCKLPTTYQIDHKIPWAISKDDTISNLQALCPNCHAFKTQRENNFIRKINNESSMEICNTFTCECSPGMVWKNKRNFNNHFKSKKHLKLNAMELD